MTCSTSALVIKCLQTTWNIHTIAAFVLSVTLIFRHYSSWKHLKMSLNVSTFIHALNTSEDLLDGCLQYDNNHFFWMPHTY